MNVKRKALKYLMIFASVLLVCMFFARTIQTITTPKVRKISATRGRLEDKISVQGDIYFSQGDPFFVQGAKTMQLTVDKVLAKQGYLVKEGDVLFEASLPTYDAKMKELNQAYEKAVRELSTEIAGHLRLKQTSEHNDLYNATIKASDEYYAKRFLAYAEAIRANYVLPDNIEQWGIDPNPPATPRPPRRLGTATPQPEATPTPPAPGHDAPKPVQDAMEAAFNAWLTMRDMMNSLRKVYVGGGPVVRTGDGTFDYIKKVDGLREQVDKALAEMLALEELAQGLTTIKAPRDGYLTSFELKVGDSYDGSKPAFQMSVQGETPTLRCDVTSIKKTLQKGTKVTVEGLKNDLSIEDIQVTSDNKKYAIIPLSELDLAAMGGLSNLMDKQISVTIQYKALKNTTLVPASAVRTDSDGSNFVYVIKQTYGGMLSNSTMVLTKQKVTVLETAAKLVSLADDLSYVDIADREDRSISDNQTVMEYVD